MVLISLMLRKNPLKNSLFFLLGFVPTLLAMGVAGFFLLRLGGSGGKGHIDGYIDIGLGVLCLLAIALVFRKKKPKDEPAKTGIKASKSAALGAATMLVNASTLIIFISGVHAMSAAKLPFYDDILSIAILTFVTLLTLLIPIAMLVAFPRWASGALASLQIWLAKHNKLIGTVILLAFAAYLLTKGIQAVV